MVSCYPIEEQIILATISEGEVYILPNGTAVDQAGVYNVVIEDEEGCPLEIYIVTVDVLSSSSSLALQNAISIAPNPSIGSFILDLSVDGVVDYQAVISDPLGKDVKTVKINQKQMLINISLLNTGVYFLRLLDEDGVLLGVKKFVVGE